MTVAFWCVLIALCLPYVCTAVAKRAHSAQLNSFEVTPAFAAAVIIADIVGNAQPVTIDVLAVLFITSRLLYIICYLADWAMLRSLVWLIGMGLIVSFFFVSM